MNKVSIKREIYLFLFGLVISLTAIYGLMISQSYHIGANESAKYGFLYELKLAEATLIKTGQLPLTQSSTLQVYNRLDDVPTKFINAFDWQSFENDEVYEKYIGKENQYGEYLYAASHYVKSNSTHLYVVSQYDEAVYLDLFVENPPESIQQFNAVFIIAGLLLLLIFIATRILIHRLTNPILVLAKWSETLDLSQAESLTQFRYAEINKLATTLINSVRQKQQAIEREEFFLRAASHELRTPISTISASVELLARLSDSLTKGGQRAIGRINRSTTTMQNLVTTLLWMSRTERSDIESNHINLVTLVEEILENHHYLVDGKDITITITKEQPIETDPLPTVLIEIIVTNLIRNAFQHTTKGNITITLSINLIQITNSLEPEETALPPSHSIAPNQQTSFGIGLMLVERICTQHNWRFHHQQRENHYIASVTFEDQSRPTTKC